MPELVEYAEASPEVRAVFGDIRATRGVPDVNNFWKALAVHPPTLARTWENLKAVMAPGALDPLGEQVARDMISVRVAPDARFVVVGAPAYFAGHPPPELPQELTGHACINLRLPTYGGLYAWEFEKDGREVKVRVEGRLVFNSIFHVLDAAVDGFGLAHVPEDMAEPHFASGRLERVLDDWCPPWPGYHLY